MDRQNAPANREKCRGVWVGLHYSHWVPVPPETQAFSGKSGKLQDTGRDFQRYSCGFRRSKKPWKAAVFSNRAGFCRERGVIRRISGEGRICFARLPFGRRFRMIQLLSEDARAVLVEFIFRNALTCAGRVDKIVRSRRFCRKEAPNE